MRIQQWDTMQEEARQTSATQSQPAAAQGATGKLQLPAAVATGGAAVGVNVQVSKRAWESYQKRLKGVKRVFSCMRAVPAPHFSCIYTAPVSAQHRTATQYCCCGT